MRCANKDFKIAEYEDRFKERTRYKKIGVLEVSFFDVWLTSVNYIYNGKLCYLEYLDSSLKSNFTLYEVREII